MSHKGDKCVETCVAAQQCHVTASDFPAPVSTLPLAVLQPTLTGVPYLIALHCRELDEACEKCLYIPQLGVATITIPICRRGIGVSF